MVHNLQSYTDYNFTTNSTNAILQKGPQSILCLFIVKVSYARLCDTQQNKKSSIVDGT